MREILHDWPDEQCKDILSNIVDTMGPESTILIEDYVLPSIATSKRSIDMDIHMWCGFKMMVKEEPRSRHSKGSE